MKNHHAMRAGSVAFVLALLAGPAMQAAGRTWGDGALPDYLAIYDVDTNGVLSVEEVQAMRDSRRSVHGQLVSHWDADHDGAISAEERAAARHSLRQTIENRRGDRFSEADSNGDGCLSLAEFSAIPAVMALAARDPQAPARIHARLDASGDGCVSLAEFTSHLRDHRGEWRTAAVFAAADVNTNGCLTQAEFSAIPEVQELAEEHPQEPGRRFAELDADHDGCLALQEFAASPQGPSAPAWRTESAYAAADADANGCLTSAEFGTIPEVVQMAGGSPSAPAELFQDLDDNRDGCLSLQEFTAPEHDGDDDEEDGDGHGQGGDRGGHAGGGRAGRP